MKGLVPVIVGIFTLLIVAGACYHAVQGSDKPKSEPTKTPAGNPQVVIDTTMGQIVVELTPDVAPATVANFLQYVDENFYQNLLFHRVMKGFMIQGGGFTVDAQEKAATHPPVRNESQKAGRNLRGTISMARTSDPHSATCQFFINTVDNRGLDYPSNDGYTVFGRVMQGMEVVDRIADVPVQKSPISNAQPLENVVIRSIRRK